MDLVCMGTRYSWKTSTLQSGFYSTGTEKVRVPGLGENAEWRGRKFQ